RPTRGDGVAQSRPARGRPHHPGNVQPALSHGAGLRGAGDGAVLQHQACLSAAGCAGSNLRQGEPATGAAKPQWRTRLAGAAAETRSYRSLLQELTMTAAPFL